MLHTCQHLSDLSPQSEAYVFWNLGLSKFGQVILFSAFSLAEPIFPKVHVIKVSVMPFPF